MQKNYTFSLYSNVWQFANVSITLYKTRLNKLSVSVPVFICWETNSGIQSTEMRSACKQLIVFDLRLESRHSFWSETWKSPQFQRGLSCLLRLVPINNRSWNSEYLRMSLFAWVCLKHLLVVHHIWQIIGLFYRAQKELVEKEQRETEEAAKKRYSHADDVRAQIREKEHVRIMERNSFFEEGVKLDEEAKQRRVKLDQVKQKKLNELRYDLFSYLILLITDVH